MRFISTATHGVLDYLMGLLLIASPWLLQFSNVPDRAAVWTPVALGFLVLIYSAMTRYELGMIPAISMPAHLGLDIASGALLAASPWLFGFAEQVWVPHFVFGVLEIGAGLMTRTTPTQIPEPITDRGSHLPR